MYGCEHRKTGGGDGGGDGGVGGGDAGDPDGGGDGGGRGGGFGGGGDGGEGQRPHDAGHATSSAPHEILQRCSEASFAHCATGISASPTSAQAAGGLKVTVTVER